MTYATGADAVTLLGNIGQRLPTSIDPDQHVSVAHAEVVDRLGRVYPDGPPVFEGDGLLVVRWAEAKVAAASILDAVRVQFPDMVGELPGELRAAAWASLDDGVVGYPPGSADVPDGVPGGEVYTPAGPMVSSFTPASNFVDPYDALRDDPDYPDL